MEKDAAQCKGHSEMDIQITQQATAKRLGTNGRSAQSSDSPEHLSKTISPALQGPTGVEANPSHNLNTRKRCKRTRDSAGPWCQREPQTCSISWLSLPELLPPACTCARAGVGTARSRDANPSSPNNVPARVSPTSRQPAVALGQGEIARGICASFSPLSSLS